MALKKKKKKKKKKNQILHNHTNTKTIKNQYLKQKGSHNSMKPKRQTTTTTKSLFQNFGVIMNHQQTNHSQSHVLFSFILSYPKFIKISQLF